MLKELTINNFMSFNEDTVFSMEAEYKRVKEHPSHIVNINNNKLLKIASIYGPNGGGKSNLLKSIVLLKHLIGRMSQPGIVLNEYTKYIFSKDNIIKLTAFFVDTEYEIGYSVSFFVNSEKIQSESLFDKNENRTLPCVFVEEEISFRRNGEKEFNYLLKRDKTGSVKCDMLVSTVKELPQIAQSRSIVTKLYDDYANNEYIKDEAFKVIKHLYEQIDSLTLLAFDQLLNFDPYLLKPVLEKKNDLKKKVIKLLKSVDIDLDDISFDNKNIYFERCNNGNELKKIPLRMESTGTIKMLHVFTFFVLLEKKDTIFLFDDINAYLHPKLCRAIYEWFSSLDSGNSQLIFNSHDILNMSKDIFRRDEIYFAYRDEKYSTNIISLSNIFNSYGQPVRRDAVYSKQYLEGKYGSDPFIDKGINWND